MGAEITDGHRAQFLARLEAIDREGAVDLAFSLLRDDVAIEALVNDLLAPAQREVGRRWEHGLWSVADEHAATAVTDAVLSVTAMEVAPAEQREETVVVATAVGEWHCLPARMVTELLCASGWRAQLIGPSAPPRDLGRFARERQPVAVIVSCSMVGHLPGAWACIDAVHGAGVPVLAGGTGFGPDGELAAAVGADAWAADPGAAVEKITAWADGGPPRLRQQAVLPVTHLQLLGRRFSVMAAACERARTALGGAEDREGAIDLLAEHAVEAAEAATLLGRMELLHGEVPWMRSVAEGRGLPPTVADEIVEAVVGEVQRAR